MTSEHEEPAREGQSEERQVHQRLLLPLLIPAGIFLFAALVIYGLSRIYLELNHVEFGDVTAATPLAIGVALAILGAAWFLASRPSISRWHLASMAAVAVLLLTGGAIAAAVLEEEEPTPQVVATATPEGGTPVPGGIEVDLTEFTVTPAEDSAPADTVTLNVVNTGATFHNLRVVKTDLAPDALPMSAGIVDEAQIDVVAETSADLDPGASETVEAQLAAGSYVLICNVPGHYLAGMHAPFTVQ